MSLCTAIVLSYNPFNLALVDDEEQCMEVSK